MFLKQGQDGIHEILQRNLDFFFFFFLARASKLFWPLSTIHKGLDSEAMVFLVVMDGCESWTIGKAEH